MVAVTREPTRAESIVPVGTNGRADEVQTCIDRLRQVEIPLHFNVPLVSPFLPQNRVLLEEQLGVGKVVGSVGVEDGHCIGVWVCRVQARHDAREGVPCRKR